ncbi:hypothetical protein U3516DRAFT_777023 [Neocallimastix sp. 'constans']
MKSLSLTIKNSVLIKIKDIDEDKINYITTMGIITRELGSVISCTIVYTEDIQNTVSISNNDRIKSYHKSLKYSMVILLIQVNLKNQFDITTGGNVFDNICASVYGKGPILNQYTTPTAAEDNPHKLNKSGTNGAGIADQKENSAMDQLNQQYQFALAGTRSSSNTSTQCSTKGSSHSIAQDWSESNTNTSGASDEWAKSNGYSDSYTTGHSETSSKEHLVSDFTSKMFSNSFNKETGWVNKESTSDTKIKGYTYGTYYYQFPEGIYIQALNTEFKYITPSHFFRISTIYIPARA